jgi:hypothetical protein
MMREAAARRGYACCRNASGVGFARIKVVTSDVRAAAWPRPSPAFDAGTAVNDGMFCTRILHQQSA